MTKINTKYMLTYLTSKTNPLIIIQHHTNLFPTHKPALKEIADGICVWDTNVSIEVLAFSQFVKQKWSHVPSNTKITKIWVKYSNECIATGKSKKYLRQVAMCWSATIIMFNEIAAKKNNLWQ